MKNVRPLYLPPPYQDSAESGRLILRDGTTATIRLAGPGELEALREFFQRLSKESRYRRFLSLTPPGENLIARLCDASDPRSILTLVVTRTVEGAPRIIATGSYLVRDGKTAEIALTVDGRFQGKGLGTLLLDRLAILAARHGITHLWAMTLPENRPVVDLLRDSGFQVSKKSERDCVEIDLSVAPTEASVGRAETVDRVFTSSSMRPFFHPKSVAVVGASRDPSSIGYRILDEIVTNGFRGYVYAVNPKAGMIGSVRAVPSVRDLPEAVDLAMIVVPRDSVLGVVDECAQKGVRALVVITAGFAETNAEGVELQRRLLEKVRGYGMRMVGPNCLGLLNTDPEVRLNASFSPIFPEAGNVAMSSQSGALGLAILRLARRRRLGLSTFISVGNKAGVVRSALL